MEELKVGLSEDNGLCFMIIKRKSDGKLLNVSDKKVRVYESMYTIPLLDEYDPTVFPAIVPDEKEKEIVNNEAAPRPETTIWWRQSKV
jgi:hypothetical protein